MFEGEVLALYGLLFCWFKVMGSMSFTQKKPSLGLGHESYLATGVGEENEILGGD